MVEHRETAVRRRTLLAGLGVGVTVPTAGCLETLQDHFAGEIQTPVPIEIHNEVDRNHQVSLQAYEYGGERQTYDEDYAIRPGPRVIPPHLDGFDQRLRIIRHGTDDMPDLVEEVSVTSDTQSILVHLYVEELEVEVDYGEAGPPDWAENLTTEDNQTTTD